MTNVLQQKSDNTSQQQASTCYKFKILAINILPDHVHLIIKSEEENIPEIIRNLKWYSSFMLSRYLRLSEKWNWRQVKIWAKHNSKTIITNEEHLNTSIKYVLNNHIKHDVKTIF